jgi:hypothetical protein
MLKYHGFHMKKSKFSASQIKNKEYPYHYIADEIITMLFEESLSEKYKNYEGKIHRTIQGNEVANRLKAHGISKIPNNMQIGKTTYMLIKKFHIEYEHLTRGYILFYSREEVNEMKEYILKIMKEDSLLYVKPCLSS